MEKAFASSQSLAESITWAASKQTFFTVRFLVDRDRVPDAYRTYAYFRWVDDRLDQEQLERPDRIAFVERQKALMEALYRGEKPLDLCTEETMLVELVQSDTEPNSGLQSYIRNMMAVMVFDAYRRDSLVSQKELAEYTRWLAIAVTEAMHYFIGHGSASPRSETRYLAVTAAHIVHMLRDTLEDSAAGYVNIPCEYLASRAISADDVQSVAYRKWVQGRVQLARAYFKAGEAYMAQVENLRCRLAGYAYMARFRSVLDSIERNGYLLKVDYPECKSPATVLRMCWSMLSLTLGSLRPELAAHTRSEAQR